ncbi:MAG: LysE family translocator [Humidesulfovibrio sp.]|nr:LysE family translocator [Humidesulfovibrio sp.]
MTTQLFTSLCLFAFATSITPGPNNALLFASGVNYGIRRTMPHLLGVTLGFTFMQLALGLGVGFVFKAVPGLYPTLRALGAAYLLYLAWRIATAAPPPEMALGLADETVRKEGSPTQRAAARPMTFFEATAFQWVNPKAVLMCVTAISTYVPPEQPVAGALLVTGVFFFAGMPCVALWAMLGSGLRGFLRDRARLRAFNIGMAVLLVASMAPLAKDILPGGLF